MHTHEGVQKKDTIAARVMRWHVEWPLSLKVPWPLASFIPFVLILPNSLFPSSLPEISKRMHSLMSNLTYRKVADDECGESPSSKYLVGNLEGSTTIAVVLVVPLFVSRSTAIVSSSLLSISISDFKHFKCFFVFKQIRSPLSLLLLLDRPIYSTRLTDRSGCTLPPLAAAASPPDRDYNENEQPRQRQPAGREGSRAAAAAASVGARAQRMNIRLRTRRGRTRAFLEALDSRVARYEKRATRAGKGARTGG